MSIVLLIIFILVTAIPWFARTSPQLLHPVNVFVIMQLALIVPGAVILIADPDMMDPRVANAVLADFEPAMSWMLFCMIVLNLCIYIAFYFWRAHSNRSTETQVLVEQPYDSYVYVTMLVGIMMASFILKTYLAGGIDYLLGNISNRVELFKGLSYTNVFEQAARLLVCFIAARVALLRSATLGSAQAWTVLGGVVALSFVIGGIFGSRKDAIDVLLLVGMTISFYHSRFFLVSPRNVALVVLGYVLVLTLLFIGFVYRSSDAQLDWGYVIESSWVTVAYMLVVESYLETYFFVTNYYYSENYYYWSFFTDLIYTFMPSSLLDSKPLTDDGVYIKYAIRGIDLAPHASVHTVVLDSSPPETLGGAYMNGGFFAVPVYGLILGSVFAFFLNKAEKSPSEPFWVLMAFFAFTTFEVSNLRIAQMITIGVAILIVRLILKVAEAAWVPRVSRYA